MCSTHHVTATATSCFHTKDTAAGVNILSLYRSEDIKLFPGIWQNSFLLWSYRFRRQHAERHRTLQTRTNWRQRLPVDKERRLGRSPPCSFCRGHRTEVSFVTKHPLFSVISNTRKLNSQKLKIIAFLFLAPRKILRLALCHITSTWKSTKRAFFWTKLGYLQLKEEKTGGVDTVNILLWKPYGRSERAAFISW